MPSLSALGFLPRPSLNFVDKFRLLFFCQVITELVCVLYAVPFVLPALLAESLVVLEGAYEEVAVGDGVEDGEAGGVAHRIGVRRQFGALHEESSSLRELLECLLCLSNDTGLDLLSVDFLSQRDCFEARHIIAADNVVTGILRVNTALVADQFSHWLKSLTVSCHDDDLFVCSEGTGDAW